MDFNRVAMLLHVVKESRDYPQLTYIHNEAMTELAKINKKATPGESVSAPTIRPAPRPELDLKGPASPVQTGEGKRVYPAGTSEDETRRV